MKRLVNDRRTITRKSEKGETIMKKSAMVCLSFFVLMTAFVTNVSAEVNPQVAAGDDYILGLKNDGTVVAIGNNDFGQCDVSDWSDIVEVAAWNNFTVGLKSDGTVVAVGNND